MNIEAPSLSRRKVLALFAAVGGAFLAGPRVAVAAASAAPLPTIEVWKNPSCGCCGGWAQHMRDAGFPVTVTPVEDMDAVRSAKSVPSDLQSCHTAVVDGYVLEGHVPVGDVKRLLAEHPNARGLAAPGMPQSAPGMDQPGEPYTVVIFGTPAGTRIFARHEG
jgi:hypothetical protein